ncbi:MAG: maleylpyruvate isomerase family mycothiol-dependent enzyme [Sporichthyaceae bacterium]
MARPLGEIYGETRLRVGRLVLGLSDAQLAAMLPTCPEWSVRDVVGHMAGLLDNVAERQLEGAGTPAFTQAQVDAYRDLPLAATIELWDARATPIEGDFEAATEAFAARLVSDTWNHEQDIRQALHLPAAYRDSDAVPVSIEGHLGFLGERLAAAGLPGLRMVTPEREWLAGGGEVGGSVTLGSQAELLRLLLGRRSRAQVAALDWDVPDRVAYAAALPRFGPAEHDIHE